MLDLPTVAFYVIAVVMVGSALAVVLLRNIVRAALFLALFFGAAAGIYVCSTPNSSLSSRYSSMRARSRCWCSSPSC